MSTPYTMQSLQELADDGVHLLEIDDDDLLATIAERDDLRAQLEAVTRELDEAQATVVTTGRTLADLKLNLDEVHAEMERQTQLKREERQAKLDAQRERDEAIERAHRSGLLFDDARKQTTEARADAARLREVLEKSERALTNVLCGLGTRAEGLAARESARAALASTPSAEPTPRDMRVAEAVRGEASDMVRDADDGVPLDCLANSIDAIDLAAVVAKAVKP